MNERISLSPEEYIEAVINGWTLANLVAFVGYMIIRWQIAHEYDKGFHPTDVLLGMTYYILKVEDREGRC